MTLRLAIILAFLTGPGIAWAGPFPLETDPGGCRIERLGGGDGRNHVLFRGVSPEGRTLAVGWDRMVDGKAERGTYLLDLKTGARRELAGLNNAASYSPDGKRLVAANYPGPAGLRTEIVELDLASGRTRSLAPDPAMEWLPSYSPDGAWVVFNSFRSGGSDLYRVRLATGEVERLTDDPRYEAHAQYYADGKRILFHRQIAGDDYGLAILDLATRRVTELAGTGREQSYPALSSDQKWIAYGDDTGQETGKPDLYVMRTHGSRKTRLTAHPDKDAYATWSPDGRFLYYMRQSATEVSLYRLRVQNGACRRG